MEDEILNKSLREFNYTFTIPLTLYNRLKNHLKALKHLNHPERKKKTWIFNAIQEKIARNVHSQEISKAKHLNLRLEENTQQKLNEKFSEISNRTGSHHSKKQWILNAIEEKLESEKEFVQNKLTEYTLENKAKQDFATTSSQ